MCEENNNNKSKGLTYHIPQKWVIALYAYYTILIFSGASLLLYILIGNMYIDKFENEKKPEYITKHEDENKIMKYTYFVSMLSSVMLSSVRYSRKLYKACIDERIKTNEDNISKNVGNIMYFFLRPIYAVIFAIIFVISILGGAFFITGGMNFVINEKMVYLSAIVSCIIGYSVGDVIDIFEKYSSDKIKKGF